MEDWDEINRMVPRIVDVLPNGPNNYTTAQLFLAGGVPEIMVKLKDKNLLDLEVLTVTGQTLGENLAQWEKSVRRTGFREKLLELDGVQPDDVIMNFQKAAQNGLTSTICFPTGNLAPQGSVVKSTAIDSTVVDPDGIYRMTGPARIFYSEKEAMRAVKGLTKNSIQAGDVIVLCGRGPMGSGMEEVAQITLALKHLSWGKHVALLTDARFSGVSTGACIGHIGPEALAGGPIGKIREGDIIEIKINRRKLIGTINFIGQAGKIITPNEGKAVLDQRSATSELQADPRLPEDTRLWAALQNVGGGTWGGCVYDTDQIIDILEKNSVR